MSAIGGKADIRELPSGCLLIARSGHSAIRIRAPGSAFATLGMTHRASRPDKTSMCDISADARGFSRCNVVFTTISLPPSVQTSSTPKGRSLRGSCMKLSSTKSKIIYVIGIVLLWMVAGIGVAWWAFTTFAVFEVQWAVLITAVFLIAVLFTSIVLSRMWRWIWFLSSSKDRED